MYLPEDWCDDPARRGKAKVPEAEVFQTKPEQAAQMLKRAWSRGVPMGWVTGDAVYGDATHLRKMIRRHHRRYVLAVSSQTPVWTKRPPTQAPVQKTGGRPRTKVRLAPGAPKAMKVAEVVAAWPAHKWQRLDVALGEKGPRTYDWAMARVIESHHGLPGPGAFLLARRSISEAEEIAYYLGHAKSTTPLLTLAQVAATRYTVEQCFEEAKGEAGLDHYEVRTFHRGYRHITLSMMAHAFLASIRAKEAKKKTSKIRTLRN